MLANWPSFKAVFTDAPLSGQTGSVTTTNRSLPRILTLMGSGETAPTMVSTHRRLAASLANGPSTVRSMVNAALLDTPTAFKKTLQNSPSAQSNTSLSLLTSTSASEG